MTWRWFGHTVEDEPEPDETCINCRHHDTVVDEDGTGEVICRCYPPTVVADGDLFVQVYPSMQADDWCGQWAS